MKLIKTLTEAENKSLASIEYTKHLNKVEESKRRPIHQTHVTASFQFYYANIDEESFYTKSRFSGEHNETLYLYEHKEYDSDDYEPELEDNESWITAGEINILQDIEDTSKQVEKLIEKLDNLKTSKKGAYAI